MKKSIARFAPMGIVVLFIFVLGGCGSQVSSPAAPSTSADGASLHLRGAGASFPAILYKHWFETYVKSHSGVKITYESVGSGEGVRRFIGKDLPAAEKVHFGASDSALTDAELEKIPSGALMLPVTAGSLVLAYNLPGYEGELKLTRKAYADIFMGSIKNWDDAAIAASNPGKKLPHAPITVVVRQDGSGTTFVFTNHLSAINPKWKDTFGAKKSIAWECSPLLRRGNEGVAGTIKLTEGSIGYVEYGYALQGNLKMATLENRDGKFVTPSESSATATLAKLELPENLRAFVPDPAGADSYPMVSLTWILLYRQNTNVAEANALKELFRWCLTEGQKTGREWGYLPLPQNISRKAYDALNDLK